MRRGRAAGRGYHARVTLPTYDTLIEPLLRALARRPGGIGKRELEDELATQLGLTAEDLAVRLPSGSQSMFGNRVGWAHDRLKRAGLSSSARRGHWRITDAGLRYVRAHPAPLGPAEFEEIASTGHRKVPIVREPIAGAPGPGGAVVTTSVDAASPEEAIEAALAELRESVAAQLLELIRQNTPQFFEGLVLDLLHAMGYGASRQDLQRLGRSGDGGIDGVISLDRLGLERVYVQAKRWSGDAKVGRPDVQAFYGALAGQRASKGVFIATASFTREAQDFAQSVGGIVLVDAERLTALMIEHEVGVSGRVLKVPRVDGDYFEDA